LNILPKILPLLLSRHIRGKKNHKKEIEKEEI